MPHIWCAGCGNGIVMKAILRAVMKLKWAQDDVVMVSGIGCSSRTPGYLDFNTLHTTHGRALAFATGVKHYKPQVKVIVVTGDGDAVAIGGNHFIHACRRNIDITAVVFNNYIYGMTGGQNSPTTPVNARTSTMPVGNIDNPFDICALAQGAGATYVARTTVAHPAQLEQLIRGGMKHKGFSVVEVRANCPTAFGRRNRMREPVAQLKDLEARAVTVKDADEIPPGELEGKIVTGLLHQVERPEFTENYEAYVRSVSQKQ
jgi:2-oxoglutarate ferredoxin oxidoreductase subunit beta